MKLLRFLQPFLISARLPWLLALLCVLLTLPAAFSGRSIDDYTHWLVMKPVPGFEPPSPDLPNAFNFHDGDAERVQWKLDHGHLPWWTEPNVKIVFGRPLSTFWHWLDYQLWPDSPLIMHLENLLCFAALIVAVTFLYRRLLGHTAVAGLAALLYAVDDSHAMPAGWIANRNSLITTFCGVMALLAYDNWRKHQARSGAVLTLVWLVIGLLGGESALATVGFLFAYALVLDTGPFLRRMAALIPTGVVVVIWQVIYRRAGYGVHNTELYVDPGSEPLRFLTNLFTHVPVLLLSQFGQPTAELRLIVPPPTARLIHIISLVFFVLLVVVLAPLVRKSKTAQFWALGGFLALLPVSCTAPMDRLLTFVSIGAMGLTAEFLAWVFAELKLAGPTMIQDAAAKWRRYVGTGWVGLQLCLAPIALPLMACLLGTWQEKIEEMLASLPKDEAVKQQDLVMVTAPDFFVGGLLAMVKHVKGEVAPARFRTLANDKQDVELYRPDASSLIVRPENGFLFDFNSHMVRREGLQFQKGEQIAMAGMTVEVLELTADGRPAEAQYRFDRALEDSSMRWVQTRGFSLVPFALPPIGGRMKLSGTPQL